MDVRPEKGKKVVLTTIFDNPEFNPKPKSQFSNEREKTMYENRKVIPGFDRYEVSIEGEVFDIDTGRKMRTRFVTGGALAVCLIDNAGRRSERSVKLLTANAFLPLPECPDIYDTPIVLDNSATDFRPQNMMWVTRSHAINYKKQFARTNIAHYNVPVRNVETGETYRTIFEAGMRTGALWRDIYNSAGQGNRWVYPNGALYEFM